ncbi:hypothetical protein SAMN05421858_4361 [Haladaptatus litoreus]|uniref:Uncharacterized protein n=1 Tax=Haladaptatus litoreus TaxID=553468 RepID=A0A1N7EL72_9EURY|nr:hypothetical protein [Haladaptatus litoreus]SIR88840.1 hypothetical protein SAMN05421858_4361 [Haladaptatus litoreus]
MARYSRRKFLAMGGASVGIGLVGTQANEYTKARITSVLSPLPGIRATGKPLTAHQRVKSKNVEYLPDTDEVRIVTARNAEGPVEFATRSFKWWAEFEAGSIATRTVQQEIPIRFRTDEDISSALESEDDQPYVTVFPTGPSITRRDLVAKLPNHVTVTVVFTGKEYTTDIPVMVGKRQELISL